VDDVWVCGKNKGKVGGRAVKLWVLLGERVGRGGKGGLNIRYQIFVRLWGLLG